MSPCHSPTYLRNDLPWWTTQPRPAPTLPQAEPKQQAQFDSKRWSNRAQGRGMRGNINDCSASTISTMTSEIEALCSLSGPRQLFGDFMGIGIVLFYSSQVSRLRRISSVGLSLSAIPVSTEDDTIGWSLFSGSIPGIPLVLIVRVGEEASLPCVGFANAIPKTSVCVLDSESTCSQPYIIVSALLKQIIASFSFFAAECKLQSMLYCEAQYRALNEASRTRVKCLH